MVEVLTVLTILLVISAIAIPTTASMVRDYRAMGDIRGIAAQATLARMRAAANFTTARVSFDLAANTYQIEIWDKTANGGLGAYRVEGAVQSLSTGIRFGYGTLTDPVGGQAVVAQPSPPQITFNSRGYLVDGGGAPIGTAAIYLDDTRKVWAVSASLAGRISAWVHSGSTWRLL